MSLTHAPRLQRVPLPFYVVLLAILLRLMPAGRHHLVNPPSILQSAPAETLNEPAALRATLAVGKPHLQLNQAAAFDVGSQLATGVLPPSEITVVGVRPGSSNQGPVVTRCYQVTAMLGRLETNADGRSCVGSIADGPIQIEWPASAGATGYRVYRSASDSAPSMIGYANGTSFRDSGAAGSNQRPPDRNLALFIARVVAIEGLLLTLDHEATFSAANAAIIPDDGPALQLQANIAIASHKPLMLAAMNYNLFTPVTFVPPAGAQSILGLTVAGAGPGNTTLTWRGPSNQSVLIFQGAKFGEISGFMIQGGAALADLDFVGHGSSGGMRLRNLLLVNPARFSFRAGNPSDLTQVSEMSFESVYSAGATAAGFQIEGPNNLNYNFYNCGCAGEPICVSNDPSIEPQPGALVGGNFNWYGGSVSGTPLGPGPGRRATFVLAGGVAYNFFGVRVENSATLIATPFTSAPIQVNWVGGFFDNEMSTNDGSLIINYQAGGSFQSTKSSWGAQGSFYFGPSTRAAVFEDDLMRVASGRDGANPKFSDYFAAVPSSVPLRLYNTSGF